MLPASSLASPSHIRLLSFAIGFLCLFLQQVNQIRPSRLERVNVNRVARIILESVSSRTYRAGACK